MNAWVRALVVAALAASPAVARADVEHVVARGHTIEAIAHRYRVTPKAIMAANRLDDPRRIRPGDVLRIPNADRPKKRGAPTEKKRDAAGLRAPAKKPATYAARPKTPHVVHVGRAATSEVAHIRVRDARGNVPLAALKAFERMMRSPSGRAHPIDRRLVAVLGLVSNHFGSRRIEIVSGFRPHPNGRRSPHSKHNLGKAIDVRVVGVPNEALRDFCRTLARVGCGYYPNSTFVHIDVREREAFWVDSSRPGEPPRYDGPGRDGEDDDAFDIDLASPEAAPRPSPPTESAGRDHG
jgi:uncharacterized protein YcbK (DUF882 family)